jgi:hypothetical protein
VAGLVPAVLEAVPALPTALLLPPPALPLVPVAVPALEVVPAMAGVSLVGASDEQAPVAANANASTQPSERERIMAV